MNTRALPASLVLILVLGLMPACGGGDRGAADTADVAAEQVCSDPCPADEPCKTWVGDPSTCACTPTARAADTACDDGNACTTGDACDGAGACVGTAVALDDGLDCTTDACDPKAGVTHTPAADSCLIADACWPAGKAQPGNPCLVCAPETDAGAWSPNEDVACDDGDPCTVDDACRDGACLGAARDCDDGNPCTFDECAALTGCTHTKVNIACDDGDPCTKDERCDDGVCEGGAAVTCDDGDPCTRDWCEAGVGCQAESDPVACDDGNSCTIDTCDPVAKACEHESIASGPCDDGDACTLGDACDAGVCVPGSDVPVCDDANPCTDDLCLPSAGCVNAFNSAPCDDGLDCTDVDTCAFGVCEGAEIDSQCPACAYEVTGQTHKALSIQMGSDGKPGSGLDVDDDPTTCAPAGKCSDGVNNALALLSAFLNPTFSNALQAGEMVFLIEFKDPTFDGTPFRLVTFFGLPHPWYNPGCPITDLDCIYVLPAYNFNPDCTPEVEFGNTTIVDGKLSAGGRDTVFPLVLPFDTGVDVSFPVLWARIQGTVVRDEQTGEIMSIEGLVGGAIPKVALYQTIDNTPDSYLPVSKEQLLSLLEATTDEDVDLDGDGEMDALSVGFRFSTAPATFYTW